MTVPNSEAGLSPTGCRKVGFWCIPQCLSSATRTLLWIQMQISILHLQNGGQMGVVVIAAPPRNCPPVNSRLDPPACPSAATVRIECPASTGKKTADPALFMLCWFYWAFSMGRRSSRSLTVAMLCLPGLHMPGPVVHVPPVAFTLVLWR